MVLVGQVFFFLFFFVIFLSLYFFRLLFTTTHFYFLFLPPSPSLPPSSPGKTYLSRLIASLLHQSPLKSLEKKGLYRKFDMGSYQTEADVNNLLGAPIGYDGGEGNLVKLLEKNPR